MIQYDQRRWWWWSSLLSYGQCHYVMIQRGRDRQRSERIEVTRLFWCTCVLDKFGITMKKKNAVRWLILNPVDEKHQCLSLFCCSSSYVRLWAHIWFREYVKISSMVSFYIALKRHLSPVFCSIFAFYVHRRAFVFSLSLSLSMWMISHR